MKAIRMYPSDFAEVERQKVSNNPDCTWKVFDNTPNGLDEARSSFEAILKSIEFTAKILGRDVGAIEITVEAQPRNDQISYCSWESELKLAAARTGAVFRSDTLE